MKAAVIGAGFGGLALAIRLQSAGIATTIVEARDRPGGRAYVWEKEGFTFDAGPTVITDPACLEEYGRLRRISADVRMVPVTPSTDGPGRRRDSITAMNDTALDAQINHSTPRCSRYDAS